MSTSRYTPDYNAGGGGGLPTFIYSVLRKRSVTLALAVILQAVRRRTDAMSLGVTLQETRRRSDAYLIPAVSTLVNETRKRSDAGSADLVLTARARSGTPDADDWGDAWTDASVGNRGVNHGNEAQLQVAALTALTEKRAFMKINLTRFDAGFAAVGGVHTLTLSIGGNGGGVTAVVLTVAFGASAASPFTESTLTQSNQPATPSLFTKTINIAAGAPVQFYTVTLSNAEMQQLVNKWALLVFTVPTLTAVTINVRGREEVDAQKPVLAFKVQK